MSSGGTAYILTKAALNVLDPQTSVPRNLGINFAQTVVNPDFDPVTLHAVTVQGNDPVVFWSATSIDGRLSSYVTWVASFTSKALDRALVGNALAITPSGDLFIFGIGRGLTGGVHRFSGQGQYIDSFRFLWGDASNLLSTPESVVVVPRLPTNSIYEYSYVGDLLHEYDFGKLTKADEMVLVRGAFVRNGTVYADTVTGYYGQDQCQNQVFSISSPESEIYRLADGQIVFDSPGDIETIPYGISPEGRIVGRPVHYVNGVEAGFHQAKSPSCNSTTGMVSILASLAQERLS